MFSKSLLEENVTVNFRKTPEMAKLKFSYVHFKAFCANLLLYKSFELFWVARSSLG